MAEKKRQCGTCRFFQDPDRRGHGKCTHPLRAGANADMIIYRANELGCRTKWGTSYWQDIDDARDPSAPAPPQQPTLPEPPTIHVHSKYDDEVTSVSIAGRGTQRPFSEDDVIDSGTTAGFYDPHLQDERRELLSRSSHDAVAAARKRSVDRMAQQRELIPFAEEEEEKSPSIEAPSGDDEEFGTAPADPFPVDDFVEEERTAHHDDDDDVVDDGLTPDIRRSPRLRNLLRHDQRPKEKEAMTFSNLGNMQVESHNPDNRSQWNSVPRIQPNVTPPFKIARDTDIPPVRRSMTASAASVQLPQPTRPVSQARDLLGEERRRAELRRRVLVTPLEDEPEPRPEPSPVRSEPDESHDEQQYVYRPHPPTQQSARPQAPESPMPRVRDNRVHEARVSPLRGHVHQPPERHTPSVRPWDGEDEERRYLTSARPIERREVRQQAPPVFEEGRYEADAFENERSVRDVASPDTNGRFPTLDMTITITPWVERVCGTCASYRARGNEGCGSCLNRDAIPEQRIVEEDGMACLSTIGSWWTPANEEVWLEEYHVPDSPTPRMDALLEELANRRRQQRREIPVLPDLEELA